MKKIIFGLLALILIIVGVFVFSIVRSFNVNSYKSQIIASLEQLTGRRVTCAQEVSLSWRPQPTFVMNDLVISNQDGSSTPNMVSIKQIQVEMDWSSFLRSNLTVKRVVLKNPNVLVERLHSYKTNFTFPYLFDPEKRVESEGILSNTEGLTINLFEVENGTITYHNDLTSQIVVFNKINGQGKVDSLNGPYAFKGHMQILENMVDVDLKVNQLRISQPLTGSLSLKSDAGNTQADIGYSLSFNKNDDWLLLEGGCSSQSPTEFFEKFGNIKWPDYGTLKGSFKWVINPQRNRLKELFFVQGEGESAVSCNVVLSPDEETKKDRLTFSMESLDYEKWQPVINKIFQSAILQTKEPILLNLSIQKLFWHEQSVSDILLQGTLKDDVLEGNASAKLPFESVFSIKGQWHSAQKSVDGEVNVQTQDLSELIQWIKGQKPTWLPAIEKGNSQWVAKINLSDTHQLLDIQSGTVGKVQVSGKVDKTDESFKTDLKIQNLNLDSYYPNLATTDNSVIQDWVLDAGRYLMGLSKNGQMNLNLPHITVFKNTFDKVIFKGKWSDQTWEIEQLDVQKENDAQVRFSGQIRQFASPEFSLHNAKLDFDMPNWSEWQNYIPLTDFYSHLKQFTSIAGTIKYSGKLNEGDFEGEGTFDQLKLAASGHILPVLQSFEKVHLKMNHADLTELMKTFQSTKELSEDWAQPVDLEGVISKDSEKISWTDIKLNFGKNTFKTSGQKNANILELNIQADKIDLGLFLPSMAELDQTVEIPKEIDMRLDVTAEDFIYNDLKGKKLKLKAASTKQKWTISALDCLIGDDKPGRLSADGTIDLAQTVQPDLHIEWDKIPVGDNGWAFGPYRFKSGVLSGNAKIKSKGDTWTELANNIAGQGNIRWLKGVFDGMDASAWLTAVQSALAAEQIGQGFPSRLQYALTNGKTNLPDLEGTFTINKGLLHSADIKGKNDLVTLSNSQVDWSLTQPATHVKVPIILTAISKLPAIVFDFNYNTYSIQNIPFEQAFDEELRLKNRQSAEARQLQNLKATELKNQQMRTEAQNIMNNMEQTLKQLQERVSLRADPEAGEKLDTLNLTAREIRELAVKVDMSPMEYAALVEKARLWAVQVTDLNNYYARQDLLNQKVKTNQLSPLVSNYLANIEQIYQQHPQSVILAEIVMNARQVASLIKEDEAKLSVAQDARTVQSIIIRIQENYDKIEKAHQYAQKLHLSMMNGGVAL